MGAPDAPSGAGATPSREPETVTFAARDASSGPDSDLVSRVFLRCAWRHDDRSFDVTLVAPGTGDEPPTVWRAANCRQPSNVRFHNWYDRAVGALASLEAGDHFRFEFAPKTRSAGTSAGALPGGVGAFLRASDAGGAPTSPATGGMAAPSKLLLGPAPLRCLAHVLRSHAASPDLHRPCWPHTRTHIDIAITANKQFLVVQPKLHLYVMCLALPIRLSRRRTTLTRRDVAAAMRERES